MIAAGARVLLIGFHMSGGGGGGSSSDSWRIGGGGASGDDKCAITERTVLNSPNAAVVSSLTVGAVLRVDLETQPRQRLVAKTTQNGIAGAITSARIVDIIECIQEGVSYEAEVIAVNGGKVEIEIRRT